MRFSINCELGYQVNSPTTMILNIEAMGSLQQPIAKSEFTVTPFIKADLHQGFEGADHLAG